MPCTAISNSSKLVKFLNTASQLWSRTHARTEGCAPVWGPEFTTKAVRGLRVGMEWASSWNFGLPRKRALHAAISEGWWLHFSFFLSVRPKVVSGHQVGCKSSTQPASSCRGVKLMDMRTTWPAQLMTRLCRSCRASWYPNGKKGFWKWYFSDRLGYANELEFELILIQMAQKPMLMQQLMRAQRFWKLKSRWNKSSWREQASQP